MRGQSELGAASREAVSTLARVGRQLDLLIQIRPRIRVIIGQVGGELAVPGASVDQFAHDVQVPGMA